MIKTGKNYEKDVKELAKERRKFRKMAKIDEDGKKITQN